MLKVDVYVLGAVSTNTYVISNTKNKDAIIVDPADRASYIKALIDDGGYNLKAIFLTHGHFDHITAVRFLKNEFKVPVIASINEKDLLKDARLNLSAGMGGFEISVEADRYVSAGEKLDYIGCECTVIETPGHTQGSVCYYFESEEILISGDTLFRESMGRTDFPTGSVSQMKHSLKEVLAKLPDDIIVYPGHGEATTIRFEKMYNPFLA